MSEPLPMLESLVADVESGQIAALCAVVEAKGSTPQPAGACMLVRRDMSTVGTLGGGCVEAEVRKRAFEMLQHGPKRGVLEFVLDHDYGWDDGLICGGRMRFGVHVVSDTDELVPYRTALSEAKRRVPTSFPLTVEQEGTRLEYRIHVEVPPRLVIAGAGHVGRAVAKLAAELDFDVTVIDDRADLASRRFFPDPIELVVGNIADALRAYPIDEGCYIVVVTRGHQHDHQALEAVVRRRAAYIGLIGSRRKSRMILRDLQADGATAEQIARVHTPIGLPIGAVTVPEIAVSIAAELVQERRRVSRPRVEGPIKAATIREESP